jgi:membrane-bound serine protease (ClpP class)
MGSMELVIALLVAGALLLVAETVLPGMVAGILGAICIVAGVIQGYVTFGPGVGNYILLGVLAGLIVGTVVWLKFFPGSRFARAFISEQTIGDLGAEKPLLLHKTGTAFSHLRPCGTAIIDGQRVDVVTEGGMIERGSPVQVVAIEGLRVVVRAAPATELSQSAQAQTSNS